MDGGCLTDIGKTLVEKLLNKAIEKSRNLFCFTCIVKEFNEEKDKLAAESATIREQFQVAINKGKGIKTNAQVWEERVGELIQENTETKKSCFFGFCPDCIWRYKRGEDLSTKTKEIRKLMEQGEKFENVELDRHLPGVERYSSQYYISFESRKLKYEELLDALRDDSNYITGLQGMGGTGKTTLAKEVGKQLKTSEQFNHVIDTTVSFTPDLKKIQDDIAGPLGLELKDINESDRPRKLWDRLTNGEKILLILDDVWGNLNFDDIGIPKSDNHKGCKVLVTTRSMKVCNQMVCEKTIQLELLNEEEAWIMFKLHADLTDISSKSILDKGRKIATECKGLPVAIATVASSLKGQKRREEWDISLKTLQKHVSMDGVGDDLVDIYKCLKFSYDFLKDKKAEGLFLLCSTFPEDAEISTEVLTRLGIGVGLFGDDYGSYEDARIQAVASKNKLLDSCLLLETKKGGVKMHDLVREVAQLIARNEIKIVNFSNKNQKSLVERDKNIKYLICEGNLTDLFASKFDGSKLEILIGDMHMEAMMHIPISFFENIPRLRVLNLSRHRTHWNDKYQHPLSLQQSMEPLSNIRSLSFERVDLGDISVFGSLLSVETLELTHCAIDELPQEIENLQNFRLLKLENCKIRNNNPFEVIQRCPSLEELYFLNSFNDFCKEITLPALQRYRLSNDFCIMNDTISKGLYCKGSYLSEATFEHVIQAIELLHLVGIHKGWRNLMPEIFPIDKGMNDLIELHLKYDSQLQCLVDTKHIDYEPNVFPNLVVLHLEDVRNLKELCNGPISSHSLNNLEKLTIKKCGNLRSLFKCSINFCNLKKLEELEISDGEKLESIITTECEEIVAGDNDNNKSCNSVFPNLKVLDISECHQLQFILPCHSAQDFLLLESISIESCDKLEYIFDQHRDVKLPSLKRFVVDLRNFIDIFPKPSSIKGSSSMPQPQLQFEPVKSNKFSWCQICCYGYKLRGSKSTKIPLVSEDQPKDCPITLESSSYYPNIWERAQCLTTSRLSHMLCNIKDMILINLPKIKSVFVMSIASKLSLETMTITNCDELEHIIVDIEDGGGGNNWGNNVFPKLKVLNIVYCKKLEYIFGHIDASDHHQNHNNEVTHLHLPSVERLWLYKLPSLIGMCTKNYHTTFPSLTKVELNDCSMVDIRSIGDFSVPKYPNKELSANVDHFLSLEKLDIFDSKVENIFFLNEVSKRQMNLGLQEIVLRYLPMMTLFKGPKNSFSLKNLTEIKIVQCGKLEIVFSTSIIMCLPQLLHIRISDCEGLKHMIEDDLENKQSSNFIATKTICFPKLRSLVVQYCKMLKDVFPISICKELPELDALLIRDAAQLKEIFVCEDGQKVNIPNLKVVAFVNLSSLSKTQGIHFQAVQNRYVKTGQELSLTSAITEDARNHKSFYSDRPDNHWYMDFDYIFQQLRKETRDRDTCNERSSSKTTEDIAAGYVLTSSQDQSIQEGSTSGTKNDQDIQLVALKQKSIKSSFEDVDLGDSHETTRTNNSQVSLNDDAFMKVSSNIEEQFPKDDEMIISKSKPSVNITSPIASQFPSIPSKDFDLYLHMESVYRQFQAGSKGHDNGNEHPNAQTTNDFVSWIELQAALGLKLTSSQIKMKQTPQGEHGFVANVTDLEIPSLVLLPTISKNLMNEQSIDQQCLINPQPSQREIDTAIKPFQGNKLKGSTTSEQIAATNLSTILGTKNESPIQLVAPKQKGIEITVEERAKSTNAKTITSLTRSELEDGDSQIAKTSFSISTTENDQVCSVSIKDEAFMKVNSNIEQQSSKDDEIIITKSNSSPIITTKGDPFQIEDDLSSSLLITRELEQLVSKKHLDHENLSFLTDFLVKNPFVLLKETLLSNRYKGYAYNCLAELLKFLKTHSVLDVLDSSHSEFVELVQDVRRCGFDKDWLDGVERRALFPDIQFSPNVLQKILYSKQQISKEVEEMRLKINILSQHVEDLKHQLTSSEAVLESIIQKEAQVLEAKATLSVPLGY